MAKQSIQMMTSQVGILHEQKADLLILALPKGAADLPTEMFDRLGGKTGPVGVLLKSGDFKGTLGKSALVYGGSDSFPRVLLVGLGDPDALDREKIRRVVAAGARRARDLGPKTVLLGLPLHDSISVPVIEQAELAAEAAFLGTYQFDARKQPDPKKEETSIGNFVLGLPPGTDAKEAEEAVERGQLRAAGTNFARDLGHLPANDLTPTRLAELAGEISKAGNLKLTVLEREEAEKVGMGAYLGVAQGSEQPPKFILMEYDCGIADAPKIGIIGKGITFDSGGISLKPSPKMDEMKYDMCGAGTVMGVMKVVSDLKIPVHVIAAIPSTENMPSGRATKPGDVHTSYSGKTIEVLNTDAEGRLVLADALTYVARNYKPAAMIDFATLTGAVIIALGHHGAAILSNDDDLVERITEASRRSGEQTWRLPIWEDYDEHLKSSFADLKNIADGNAGGGTIAGGAFLREFVEETPWAHIDIAGTAWWDKDRPHVPKGATGFGVRLVLELLEGYSR